MAITDEEVDYICKKTNCQKMDGISFGNMMRYPDVITHKGILQISQMKWDSLTSIHLGENSII
jgi:hypothetical protein